MKITTAATADKQEQHAAMDHSGAKATRIGWQDRWSNWVEEQNRKNAQRASKPDNIVVAKIAVVLCVGLLVWCYYVYVGRICTPMIRQEPGARGSRAEGIVFLIFFNILWLLMVYTYTMVCTTPPGFARDVVERGPRPEPPWLGYPPSTDAMHQFIPYGADLPQQQNGEQHQLVAGPQYTPHVLPGQVNTATQTLAVQASEQSAAELSANTSDMSDHTLVQQPSQFNPRDRTSTSPNPYGSITPAPSQAATNKAHPLEDTQIAADNYGQTGALGAGVANAVAAINTRQQHECTNAAQQDVFPQTAQSVYNNSSQYQSPQQSLIPHTNLNGGKEGDEEGTFKRKVYREPPVRLPLHPNTRYCERCELVKPNRAHHCRHCGTCVLGMDHHCPWIGQCCGARNHIYFVAFCFWSCIALGYIFITLLIALIAPNVNPTPEIDVQTVVICAIAAVLSFFTGSMFTTHIVLILNGQSTIENISIGDMKHRETSALNRHYSLFSFKSKNRERRLMDKEWGKLDTEANLWYQGNKKKNWEMTMGNTIWKCLLPPPGYRPDNGVDYIPNPRRGPNGEWRRRGDWPEELR